MRGAEATFSVTILHFLLTHPPRFFSTVSSVVRSPLWYRFYQFSPQCAHSWFLHRPLFLGFLLLGRGEYWAQLPSPQSAGAPLWSLPLHALSRSLPLFWASAMAKALGTGRCMKRSPSCIRSSHFGVFSLLAF